MKAIWLENLKKAIRILAAPAAQQSAYLEEIGTPGCADELALQFDDSYVLGPELLLAGMLNEDQLKLLDELNQVLVRMSEPGTDLWSAEGLATSLEWQNVRRKA